VTSPDGLARTDGWRDGFLNIKLSTKTRSDYNGGSFHVFTRIELHRQNLNDNSSIETTEKKNEIKKMKKRIMG